MGVFSDAATRKAVQWVGGARRALGSIMALFALALGLGAAPAAQAQITGYVYEPDEMQLDCGVGKKVCFGPIKKLDKVYMIGMGICKSWIGPPMECVDPTPSGGTNMLGYSADPYRLAQEYVNAAIAYQNGFDISYAQGQFFVMGHQNCVESFKSNGELILRCTLIGQNRAYNRNTGEMTYGAVKEGPSFVLTEVSKVNLPVVCKGYVPNLGCPSTTADRTPAPLAASCVEDPADPVPDCLKNPKAGNPISLLTGAKIESRVDLTWPLELSRSYVSNWTPGNSMGSWRHNHDSNALITMSQGFSASFVSSAIIRLESGDELPFSRPSASEPFTPIFPDHQSHALEQTADGLALRLPSGERRLYSQHGLMLWKKWPAGYRMDYAYDAAGSLLSVTDSYGRGLAFAHSGGRLTQVSSTGVSAIDTMSYGYADGELASATFNASESVTYGYTAGKLTSITDALGNAYAQFAYDASGRAIQTKRMAAPGQPTEQVDVSYGASSVTVTEAGGATVYNTQRDPENFKARVASVTRPAGAAGYSISYTSKGKANQVSSSGLTNYFSFDQTTGLPAYQTRFDGSRINFTWDEQERRLIKKSEPSANGTRLTEYGYDTDGNLTSMIVTPTVGGARSMSWTHASLGKIASVASPDGSTLSYEYYPDDDSSPERRGRLSAIVDPLGRRVTVSAYDPRGNPSVIVDESGVETSMTYDARGRMLTRARLGVSETMSYDAAGQLASVSGSNGVSLTFAYDQAHRLTGVTSATGESIAYAYDAAGNRSQETVRAGQALQGQVNRVFNALGQIQSAWGADPTKSLTMGYNAKGQLTSMVDQIGRSSTFGYNTRGETTSYSDKGMASSLARDADGNIKSYSGGGVTNTVYAWNDYQEPLSVTGPDSGAQSFARDIQARTESMTDAAGVLSVTSFDELGRVSALTRQLGARSESSAFVYESSGARRLISATDPSSSQAWEWGPEGLPSKKTQTIGAASLQIQYAYDGQGQLSSMTYPSGMVVGYGWANGRVSEVTVNGQALISGLQYRAFSNEPSAWSWAAGGSYQKSFDAEGQVSGVADTGVLEQAAVFDPVGRLTSLLDAGLSLSASYKPGDQLASATINGAAQTYSFDANWNRKSKVAGGVTQTSTITASSNKIASLALTGQPAIAFGYDANNNVIAKGADAYGYDLAGNMASAARAGVSALYEHNVFRQRVSKTVDGVKTIFAYDESGNLIGEYDAGGALIMEHIYLGALPIGVSAGGSTRQVHTDYLGTPRVITQAGSVVWKWDLTDPFGGNAPSVQAMTYNPRFAGQYYDAETGLHYNRHRTYDPQTGRYLQPDPLGLAAGKNPFNYVNQNPLNATDPDGLKMQLIWQYDPAGAPHIMLRITNPGMEDKTYSLRVNGDRGFWLKLAEAAQADYKAASKSGSGLPARSFLAARESIFTLLYNLKAERLWGPDAAVAELSNQQLYDAYENTSAIYHVLTFDSSRQEESSAVNDLINASYGIPYSIIPGIGQQCATSADRALAASFADYKKTGALLPETLFRLIQQSSFAKGRRATYDFHDIHTLTGIPRREK